MLRISKDHHIHRMNHRHSPCLSIESGTRLIVETWDALKGKAWDYFEQNTPREQIVPHANPATGPIYVYGAEPGDTLEVEVHNIKLDEYGYINRHLNMITAHENNSGRELIRVKVQGNYLLSGDSSIQMPIEPMIGVIGTSPPEGVDMLCQETGDHGGNMDAKVIRSGTKVHLPVFVQGGLLSLGDVHAAMGDGEVFGQGIEIGSEVELTIRILKQGKLRRPMVHLEDRLACIASREDIYEAKDLVIQDLGDYLMEAHGIKQEDAYALIAYYANLQFCQVVNPQKTVRLELEHRYIALYVSNHIYDVS